MQCSTKKLPKGFCLNIIVHIYECCWYLRSKTDPKWLPNGPWRALKGPRGPFGGHLGAILDTFGARIQHTCSRIAHLPLSVLSERGVSDRAPCRQGFQECSTHALSERGARIGHLPLSDLSERGVSDRAPFRQGFQECSTHTLAERGVSDRTFTPK